MVKRQLPRPLHSASENVPVSNSNGREISRVPKISRSRSVSIDRRLEFRNPSSKALNGRLHKTASFESINVLQCMVCNSRVNSPKMMKCRHIFCLKCFKNRFMISQRRGEFDLMSLNHLIDTYISFNFYKPVYFRWQIDLSYM
ncbi:hypothetical protein PUN28_001797 [Cardiocondyla obscurior]|uniref:Zinc finger C3HC4 RING-type domain-containing protein n=1 Tax=Cardiocondyla obscurior TaxID=286306 RepID=A0AAW2GRB8_9HYME